MRKKWHFYLLALCLFFAVERFCHRCTHGFCLYKIFSSLPYNPQFDVPLTENQHTQLKTIFSQPFYFLAQGGECYVFVSQDGLYVLKFFKHHHMRSKTIFDPLLSKTYLSARKNRLQKLFTSCSLAYDHLQEDTGLIYLHLTKTTLLCTQVTLFDPIGIKHVVALDHLEFALQKKADLAYPVLNQLLSAKQYEKAQNLLDSFFHMIVNRCKAGILACDFRKRNIGFIGGQATQLDLGIFSQDETTKELQNTKRIFAKQTEKLDRFIQKNHPDFSSLFKQQRENFEQKIEK